MIHLSNEPEDISKRDLFITKPKADTISTFLIKNLDNLGQTKIFALYGRWGSGKTSLMAQIEKNLESNNYKSYFFRAWEHEKDDNLSLSLCDILASEITLKTLSKEFIKYSLLAFKSLGKGISLSYNDIGIKPKDIIEASDSELKKIVSEYSFHQTNNLFKQKLLKLEKGILKKFKAKKIIIFIDDLDRCEPESVLKLLSTIKLFFTYGNDIVFFIGIDKESVKKAVQLKYRDLFTAEEYLEKIVDISFSMPSNYDILPIVEYYFPETVIENGTQLKISPYIHVLLNSIGFTNPRHLKKILNKYQILRQFKELKVTNYNLIPNICYKGQGTIAETILTLYFIILYDFYNQAFMEMENYETRINHYGTLYYQTEHSSKKQGYTSLSDCMSHVHNPGNFNAIAKHESITLHELSQMYVAPAVSNNQELSHIRSFLNIFTPFNASSYQINFDIDKHLKQFDSSLPSDEFQIKFCSYLFAKRTYFSKMDSSYKMWDYFNMCRTML